VGRPHESGVAETPPAAADGHDFLAFVNEVGDEKTCLVSDHGAQGYAEDKILPGFAMTGVTLAVGAIAGGVVRIPLIAEQ
jgi:hypothetical protein